MRNKILEDISFCFTADFKQYLLRADAVTKIASLKAGLDSISISHIDAFVNRMLNFPSANYSGMIVGTLDKIIASENLGYNEGEIAEHIHNVSKKRYKISQYPVETFYFYHGLKFLDSGTLSRLADGDFLDCGAYIGDSALALLQYKPKKIYSFEVSKRFLGEYQNTMSQNGVSPMQAEVFHCGTGLENKSITFSETNSAGNNISTPGNDKVDITTIDSFVEKYTLKPSLLKMDVEGEELNTILGAANTLRKFKPVISVAIYHNPSQFFELKTLIDSWGIGYQFIIRSLRPRVIPMEMTLIAYQSRS